MPTFKCPQCKKSNSVSTLVGVEAVACKSCSTIVPKGEILELTGEVICFCPCCAHEFGVPEVCVQDILCCPECHRGFTGGAMSGAIGSIVNDSRRSAGATLIKGAVIDDSQQLSVTYVCSQVTITHMRMPLGSQSASRETLEREGLVYVLLPQEGASVFPVVCGFCGNEIDLNITSLEQMRRQRKAFARWSYVGLVLIAATPVWCVYFGSRWPLATFLLCIIAAIWGLLGILAAIEWWLPSNGETDARGCAVLMKDVTADDLKHRRTQMNLWSNNAIIGTRLVNVFDLRHSVTNSRIALNAVGPMSGMS